MRRLLAKKRHRLRGTNRRAHDRAGGAVDAARQIDAEHRRTIGVDGLDHRLSIAPDRPVEPCAEQRIDNQRGRAERRQVARQHRPLPTLRRERGIAFQAIPLAHQDDRDFAAARCQFAGSDKSIAAIIAASGDNQYRTLIDEVGGGVRNRLSGTQHQRETRFTTRNSEPVGLLHFAGRQNVHGLTTCS